MSNIPYERSDIGKRSESGGKIEKGFSPEYFESHLEFVPSLVSY